MNHYCEFCLDNLTSEEALRRHLERHDEEIRESFRQRSPRFARCASVRQLVFAYLTENPIREGA